MKCSLVILFLLVVFTAGSVVMAKRQSTRFVPLNFFEVVQHYHASSKLANSLKEQRIPELLNGINFNSFFANLVQSSLHSLVASKNKLDPDFPTPNVTLGCEEQLASLLAAFTTNQLWAFELLDSFGKPPAGLLEGALFWSGDYNECINITQPTFQGRYCVYGQSEDFSMMSLSTSIKYGLCFGNKCSENDIAAIINFAIQMIPSNITNLFPFLNKTVEASSIVCQPETSELNSGAVTALIIIGVLVGLVALGTILDIYKRWVRDFHKEILSETNIIDTQSQVTINNDEKEKLIERYQDENESKLFKILISFSAYTNTIKLFTISKSNDQLECLNAIRFLSLAWVILGHTYGFVASYVDNLAILNTLLKRFSFLFVSNAFFSVDNFFLMSGLLTSYLFMREIEKTKRITGGLMVKYYLHRIWRLTPPYMLVLMFSATLTQYLGNGPVYPVNGFEINQCKDTWWTNLLYINNFVKPEQACLGVSWYLANDMQFHWVSPIMVIPFALGQVALGIVINVAIIIAHIIATALIINHYPGTEMGMLSQNMNYFYKVYITPWCRIGPYAVGIMLGYAIYAYKKKGQFKIRKDVNIFGWIISLTSLGVLLFGIYPDFNGQPLSRVAHILYQASSRTLWTMALGYIIYACITSNGGIINKLLSLPIWTPLSRLSFSAYLFHAIVIFYYIYTQERPIHVQDSTMIYFFVSTTVFSYVAAYLVSIVFEVPLLGLEKFILHR